MNIWIIAGATLLLAYLMKRFIADKLKIPGLTIFMILGIALGSTGFNIYTPPVYDNLFFLSDLVLGIIAFIMGSELSIEMFKRMGKIVFLIALGEVVFVNIFVPIVMSFFPSIPIYTAIMFGTVAAATAPAATVYVIKEYRTKGPFTTTILGVVGIDDAIAIAFFAFTSIVAQSLILDNHTGIPFTSIFFNALSHIGLSVIVGFIGAILFILLAKKIHSREILLTLILGFIVISIGITRAIDASQLLALIIFGLTVVSFQKELTERTLDALEPLYEMLIPFFFILAGSTFDWQFAVQTFAIGIAYTIALFASRYAGAFSGALIAGSDKQTRKLIGLTLMPQAGIAFGLILVMPQLFGGEEYGIKGQELIRIVSNTLIWTTLITETIGPLLTRYALSKAGEIGKNDHPFPTPE